MVSNSEERFDLEIAQKRLEDQLTESNGRLPIVDESRINKRYDFDRIKKFLTQLEIEIYPGGRYSFEPDFEREDLIHVHPFPMTKSFGARLKNFPDCRSKEIYPVRTIDHPIIEEFGKERIIKYRVLLNDNGERPPYDLLWLHSFPDKGIRKIIRSI